MLFFEIGHMRTRFGLKLYVVVVTVKVAERLKRGSSDDLYLLSHPCLVPTLREGDYGDLT